jgi:SAM-dependent methyltransferase
MASPGTGAFYTPRPVAERAVELALAAADAAPRRALDPSCGEGVFLGILESLGLESIEGWDIDGRALAVARERAGRARLVERDALLDEGLHPDPYDLVVGNPPFVPPEEQGGPYRARLRRRFPWLHGRFDLAVPFASLAADLLRPGGGLCLVLPTPLLSQPYGRELRRTWLARHRITHIGDRFLFPGAAVEVRLVALRAGAGPAAVGPEGIHASELLGIPNAPITTFHRPGDLALLEDVRAASRPLGSLARVDTGLVAHGVRGGKELLLSEAPGPGRVPFVDARDLAQGRRRYLIYEPSLMHRPKDPSLFEGPKLLVGRILGRREVFARVDRENLYAGHTLNVVRPHEGAPSPERLLEIIQDPLQRGILLLEKGERLDLYPADLAAMPVPRVDPGSGDLASALGLKDASRERLLRVADETRPGPRR